jgi:hypothetical protein
MIGLLSKTNWKLASFIFPVTGMLLFQQIHCSRILVEKLPVLQLIKTFADHYETGRGSLPFSQQPATDPYIEQRASSSQIPSIFHRGVF